MEKRYRALRFIAVFYKILGVIAGLIDLLLVVGACASSFVGSSVLSQVTENYGYTFNGSVAGLVLFGLISGLLLLILGGDLALTLFAIGEGISLFIALEENTRATLLVLQHQAPVTYAPPASSVVRPYGDQPLPAAQ